MIKIKNDKFRKARGGKAKLLDVICAKCGEEVLLYQKDGDGNLLRCYLNRIFAPVKYESLQHDLKISEPKDMPNLICEKCGEVIGTPMRHQDGRLAFKLRKGFYTKKTSRKEVIDG